MEVLQAEEEGDAVYHEEMAKRSANARTRLKLSNGRKSLTLWEDVIDGCEVGCIWSAG